MRNIKCLCLVIILLGVLLGQSFITVNAQTEEETSIYIVSLGDSISAGYGLAGYNAQDLSLATNSYINLLGKEWGTKPNHFAVEGITTTELSEQIKRSDVQKAIMEADYITVSIGGNNIQRPMLQALATGYGIAPQEATVYKISQVIEEDLLLDAQNAKIRITFGLLKGLSLIEDGVDTFEKDFKVIIDQLRLLAPDAKIMVSTLYNPFGHFQNTELTTAVQLYIDRMNLTIIKTNKTEPYLNAYYVVDVNKVFSVTGSGGLVNADDSNGKMNIDPHPTEAGHALIYNAYSNLIKGFAFNDINQHYAKNSILYLVSTGILNGKSPNQFAPNEAITRAQFVKMLYGIAGGASTPSVKRSDLTDIKDGDWFTPYVDWAVSNNIVLGNEQNQFLPNQKITRQDMCVMMSRFIKIFGSSTTVFDNKGLFVDDKLISSYAKESVYQAKTLGLISGKQNNLFDPLGIATRGEAAVIIERYLTN